MLETLALVRWDSDWPLLLATFILAYLLGSIPFGLIFGWLAGAGDIRKIGSGNIGATNVLRTGNRWAAAATLIGDGGKAVVAVLVAQTYFGLAPFLVIAGFGAFVGHVYPVWLGFRGGKGVASFIGVTLALDWPIGLLTCASWLVTARTFRISSLAALVTAAMTPLYFVVAGELLFAALALVLALLIFISHWANLERLWRGEEPRIGKR
jgi:acyl phosphate:glycerol-3-phosphate acyltransferase